MSLTFSQFLTIVEDAQGDAAAITAQISQIDVQLGQIAQKSQPLLQKKQMLQKQLMQKAQQAQATSKQPLGNATMTTTPGSGGAQTPGNGQPGMGSV